MKVIFPNFAHIFKTPWKYEISEHLKCSISSYIRSYFQVDPLTFFCNFLNFYLYFMLSDTCVKQQNKIGKISKFKISLFQN